MKALNVYEENALYDKSGVVWHWITPKTLDGIEWETITTIQTPNLNKIQKPYLARYLTTLRAAWKARNCDLIVTHGEPMAIWTGIFMRLFGARARHLAWSFTMPDYDGYGAVRKMLLRFGMKHVDQLVMFSEIETRTYPPLLGVDAKRFRMIPWSADGANVDKNAAPMIEGEYIAAIGGEGRDYATLFKAMEMLPERKLAVVASPKSVEGLDIPDNVTLFSNIPFGDAMNIAAHADFLVLPLVSETIPCGHGSIVSQFYLEKATIVTTSQAMNGYAFAGENVLEYPAQDATALKEQITRLYEDTGLRDTIAANGLKFAKERCSEPYTIEFFNQYVRESGLLNSASGTSSTATVSDIS
jgi:glycosyltransferase involved in cell wall biosynthesis